MNWRSLVLPAAFTIGGALAGAFGSVVWYDQHFKVPNAIADVCYSELSSRLDGRVSPRHVSGGKRDYGWEFWIGLYDGPGPDFSSRSLVGVAHCKVLNEYSARTGNLEPKVAEFTTSFDHLLR